MIRHLVRLLRHRNPPSREARRQLDGELTPQLGRVLSAGDVPVLNVYLAGRFARREELRLAATDLAELGCNVTSRWLFVDASIPGGVLVGRGRAAEIARMDFEDVKKADVCIAFTEPVDGPQGRGGRHTELGIALALGHRILIVGPREHVFHCHAGIEHCSDWSEARAHLARMSAQRELAAA